jgi:hypothetical protein
MIVFPCILHRNAHKHLKINIEVACSEFTIFRPWVGIEPISNVAEADVMTIAPLHFLLFAKTYCNLLRCPLLENMNL